VKTRICTRHTMAGSTPREDRVPEMPLARLGGDVFFPSGEKDGASSREAFPLSRDRRGDACCLGVRRVARDEGGVGTFKGSTTEGNGVALPAVPSARSSSPILAVSIAATSET
jgi:hypothetical protein